MKVTTVHNAVAGMVQMYSELLEEQVKENIELKNQLRGYVVENERAAADIKELRALVAEYKRSELEREATNAAKVPLVAEIGMTGYIP